jgi:WhiB family transcriptional regulator, redox-sensing transcriptional regulator
VSWQQGAACTAEHALLFFGPDDEAPAEQAARERKAKAVCAPCPVRAECLDDAFRNGAGHGIWGGLNEVERSVEHRRRLRGAYAGAGR